MKYTLLLVVSVAIACSMQSCAKPVANFALPGSMHTTFQKLNFNNTSKGATKYVWDFGDGKKSEEKNPVHSFNKAGVYTVSLKAVKGNQINEKQMTIKLTNPENCRVLVETSLGKMVIRLYDETPKHRDNFLKLVGEGFYDSLLFHRVIQGFMVQGGDPGSKAAATSKQLGSGGPGYTVPAEFNPAFVHTKGALAAARMGDNVNPEKASSGSQFYIVHGRPVNQNALTSRENSKDFRYPTSVVDKYLKMGGVPFLDMDYTVFGEVIEGLEIIDEIAAVATNPGDRPKENVWMKMSIVSK